MIRLVLKQTLAHRRRLLLTVVAVTLGVTFVTGSLVLTDTSRRVFDDQFRTASAGVDVTVRDAVAFDSAMGVEVERDPLPADTRPRVAATRGVGDAVAVAKGSGLLEHAGTAIVPRGPSMLSSWVPTRLGGWQIRSGRTPADVGEVVLDAATARAHGISLGDRVTVQSERRGALTVVGLAGFGDQDGVANATMALVGLPEAQRLLDLGDGYSEVLVAAADGVGTADLRDRLGGELGAAFDVAAAQDTADASAAAAKEQLAYLQVMLLVLAATAFVIGAFLIANTFSIVVSQRTRELALLRAAGATGRQVLLSVLGEAAAVAFAGSLVGVGLGVLAAGALRDLAGAFGVVVPDAGMVVLPRTVLVSLALGVLVTTLAALGPSRRAARVAPVQAMRAADPVRPAGRARTATGLALAGLGLVSGVAGVVTGGLAAVAAGALTLVIALVVLGPVMTPGLARVAGRPLRSLGVPGTLAGESAARAPRRTAATVLALALSLALITSMAVLAASVKQSIRSTYQEVVTADFVVESARGEMLGGLTAAAYRRVRGLDEVDVVSRLRYGHWKDGTATRALTAIDPETLAAVTHIDMTAGSLSAVAGGGILLADDVARNRGLDVGDTIPMTFARVGERDLRVVGLIDARDAEALSTKYIVSLTTYARLFSERMDANLFVRVADGVADAQAKTALDRALAELPTAEVRDQEAAVDGRSAMVDQILGLVTVLLLFTVLIATLGITNTLALSIVERTREIGLLRAVGMTRPQLRRMVQAEALLVAALSVVLGVALGLAFGAAVVRGLAGTADVPLAVPGWRLVEVVLLATAAGLVAGMAPARRASRLGVLAAIAVE